MAGGARDAKRARTSRRILESAQEEFALHGFKGATIRSIADRAGVHASLVMQHYGSKASLFSLAARLPADDEEAASEHVADVLDVRMTQLPPQARALLRSMLTVPEAEASVRAFLEERVENLKGSFEGEDAELRAALTVSSILGLTIARHFLKLQAFENIGTESLVRAASVWIDSLGAAPGGE